MVDLAQALRRKEDIVFLDIETTGLSRVYDYVTVIGIERNGVYHAHKEGDSMEKVHKMLRGANTLVTFNGTLFDVKFLQHHFKDLVFPPHHIDLRFLMRRIGYTGGQKAIEVSLGLKREEEVRGLTGYEAVVLWHEYRRGSIPVIVIRGVWFTNVPPSKRVGLTGNFPDVLDEPDKVFPLGTYGFSKILTSYCSPLPI
jgi:uncharacterized protein YprB with RNaseH-like and TPR domain